MQPVVSAGYSEASECIKNVIRNHFQFPIVFFTQTEAWESPTEGSVPYPPPAPPSRGQCCRAGSSLGEAGPNVVHSCRGSHPPHGAPIHQEKHLCCSMCCLEIVGGDIITSLPTASRRSFWGCLETGAGGRARGPSALLVPMTYSS